MVYEELNSFGNLEGFPRRIPFVSSSAGSTLHYATSDLQEVYRFISTFLMFYQTEVLTLALTVLSIALLVSVVKTKAWRYRLLIPPPPPILVEDEEEAGEIVEFAAQGQHLMAITATGLRFSLKGSLEDVFGQLETFVKAQKLATALNHSSEYKTPQPQAPVSTLQNQESSIPGSVLRAGHLPPCSVLIHAEPGASVFTGIYGGGTRLKIKTDALKGTSFLYTAYHVIQDVRTQGEIYLRANGKDIRFDKSWKVRAQSEQLDFVLIEIPGKFWAQLGVATAQMSTKHNTFTMIKATHVNRQGQAFTSLGKMLETRASKPGFICHSASTRPGSSGHGLLSADNKYCYGVHTLGSKKSIYKSEPLNEASSTIYLDPRSCNKETPWDEKLMRLMGKQEYLDYIAYMEEQGEDSYFSSQQEAEYFNDLHDDVEYYTMKYLAREHQFHATIYSHQRDMMSGAQYDQSVLHNRFGALVDDDDDNMETSKIKVLAAPSEAKAKRKIEETAYLTELTSQKLVLSQHVEQVALLKSQQAEIMKVLQELSREKAQKHLEEKRIIAEKKEQIQKSILAQSALRALKIERALAKVQFEKQESEYLEKLRQAKQAVSETEAFAKALEATPESDPTSASALPEVKEKSLTPVEVLAAQHATPAVPETRDDEQKYSSTKDNEESSSPLFRLGSTSGLGPTPKGSNPRKSRRSRNTKNSQARNGSSNPKRPPRPHYAKPVDLGPMNTPKPKRNKISQGSGLKA